MPASACRINDIEAKYYADGEDAYDMRKYLRGKPPPGEPARTRRACLRRMHQWAVAGQPKLSQSQ